MGPLSDRRGADEFRPRDSWAERLCGQTGGHQLQGEHRQLSGNRKSGFKPAATQWRVLGRLWTPVAGDHRRLVEYGAWRRSDLDHHKDWFALWNGQTHWIRWGVEHGRCLFSERSLLRRNPHEPALHIAEPGR